jgi:hypothetical protein
MKKHPCTTFFHPSFQPQSADLAGIDDGGSGLFVDLFDYHDTTGA